MSKVEDYYNELKEARRKLEHARTNHLNLLSTTNAALMLQHNVKPGDRIGIPGTHLTMTLIGMYSIYDGEFYRIRVSGTLWEGDTSFPFHLLMDEGDELEIKERADG